MLRTVVQGRRRDVGLGNTELVSLSEARELAIAFRRTARAGGDPTAERRRQRISVPTFEDASWRTRAEHKSAWRNAKSRVDQIETPDILRVLSPHLADEAGNSTASASEDRQRSSALALEFLILTVRRTN